MDDYPKTKDEWWDFVEKYWEQLESIVMNYYPNQSTFPKDGWPLTDQSLHAPQQACNTIIKSLRKEKPIWETLGSFNEYLLNLKRAKDIKLAEIFEESWFGIPETSGSRNIPGLFVFCDLCSESYVLYEEN